MTDRTKFTIAGLVVLAIAIFLIFYEKTPAFSFDPDHKEIYVVKGTFLRTQKMELKSVSNKWFVIEPKFGLPVEIAAPYSMRFNANYEAVLQTYTIPMKTNRTDSVGTAREESEARGETFYPGPSRSHLAAYPPKERWDNWTELDSQAWPRRKERHYSLVTTTWFNCESACGLWHRERRDLKPFVATRQLLREGLSSPYYVSNT